MHSVKEVAFFITIYVKYDKSLIFLNLCPTFSQALLCATMQSLTKGSQLQDLVALLHLIIIFIISAKLISKMKKNHFFGWQKKILKHPVHKYSCVYKLCVLDFSGFIVITQWGLTAFNWHFSHECLILEMSCLSQVCLLDGWVSVSLSFLFNMWKEGSSSWIICGLFSIFSVSNSVIISRFEVTLLRSFIWWLYCGLLENQSDI